MRDLSRGINFEEFTADDMISSAVIRKFEILGEASKHVPEEIRTKYPQIPWKDMSGMRDILIHFYSGIKYELVWQTIKDVIPVVAPLMQGILRDIKSE